MKKLQQLLLAMSALVASAQGASALTIDFGLATRALSDSLTYSVGGYTVAVTAKTTDADGNVTGTGKVRSYGINRPNQGGLGVINGVGDAHTIDGSGAAKDMLILTFDRAVKVSSMTFANIDGNDDARIFAGGSLIGSYVLAAHPSLLPLNSIGTVFGIMAPGKNDNFKLRSVNFDAVTLSTIPLPPAAVLLGSGLVGLGALRKRRKAR
jgi:hypothetical protein